MQKVEYALIDSDDNPKSGSVDDPEYDQQLIIDCNMLSIDIENEIVLIHNFIRDKYQLKVPELESFITQLIMPRLLKNLATKGI